MKIDLSGEYVKEHDRREDELLRQQSRDPAVRMQLLMSRQLWRDNGQWERYYQAREGRVHATRYCPTLSETTALTALWEFSGEPVDVVIAAGRMVCRKCFPEAKDGMRKRAVVCPGSGSRSRCRCGDRQCRQMCTECGRYVLVTPSGVLRRHG